MSVIEARVEKKKIDHTNLVISPIYFLSYNLQKCIAQPHPSKFFVILSFTLLCQLLLQLGLAQFFSRVTHLARAIHCWVYVFLEDRVRAVEQHRENPLLFLFSSMRE